MIRRPALLIVTALVAAAPAAAQEEPSHPKAYAAALARLQEGDTTVALQHLRRLTESHPGFGPGFLTLGEVLTGMAGEVERDFVDRREAERALDRAFRLLGTDPSLLLQYGLLLRKRQIRVDARRVLDRAWHAALEQGRAMPPPDLAKMHFALGKIYEAWWEDWQDLLNPEVMPALTCPAAGGGGLAAIAIGCPEVFAQILEQHPLFLDQHREDERQAMIRHFRLALEADPGHVDAAVHLLGHLADAEDWDSYEDVSRQLLRAAPHDGRAHLFRGLYLHQRGRTAEAGVAFREAMALLEPASRVVFDDVSPLLRKSVRHKLADADSAARAYARGVFFTSADPSWLTDENERLLEHYARLAWAELKFAAPASGLRGWDSDRGQIWVRYGRPRFSFQCCFGDVARSNAFNGSQRTLYWSYGVRGPVFVFRRNLTYRRAGHSDESYQLAEDLAERMPERYAPRTITSVHDVPHQVARFRGSAPGYVQVEVYAEPPLDSLYVGHGAAFDAGLFYFGPSFEPLWRHTRSWTRPLDRPLMLSYKAELPAGEIRYGIEARASAPDSIPRPLARQRGTLTLHPYPADALSVSDILLAEDVRATADPPRTRADLDIVARRSTDYVPGEALSLYFEVYGLASDDEGRGRYEVTLAFADSTRRHPILRAARGLERLFAGGGAAAVRWEREAPVVDGTTLDYLALELPPLDPGEYALEIAVRDLGTGAVATTRRRFSVRGEAAPGGAAIAPPARPSEVQVIPADRAPTDGVEEIARFSADGVCGDSVEGLIRTLQERAFERGAHAVVIWPVRERRRGGLDGVCTLSMAGRAIRWRDP